MNFKEGDKVTVKSRNGKVVIAVDNVALVRFDKPDENGFMSGVYNIKRICHYIPIDTQLLFSFMEED